MLKSISYTTLSSNNEGVTLEYHDRDSLPFEANYPLIGFSDNFINPNANPKILEKYLSQNFWYQKANAISRKKMLKRIVNVNKNIAIVLNFIKDNYGYLDQKCLHISIAGSYTYSQNPGDIDLDVVIDGSYFDYNYFSKGIAPFNTTGNIKKISLTVMGIDNINGNQLINSNIENDGFLHQDTILREMLVAPMRNVTVYGKPFLAPDVFDERNIIVRVARQLYFASLTLQGKIPYYSKDPLRTKKAISRINEAHDILEWIFLSTKSKK